MTEKKSKKEFQTPHYQNFVDNKYNASIYREEKVRPITFGQNTKNTSAAESPYKNSKMDEIILSPEKVMEKREFLKRKSSQYNPHKSIEREKLQQKSKSTLDA